MNPLSNESLSMAELELIARDCLSPTLGGKSLKGESNKKIWGALTQSWSEIRDARVKRQEYETGGDIWYNNKKICELIINKIEDYNKKNWNIDVLRNISVDSAHMIAICELLKKSGFKNKKVKILDKLINNLKSNLEFNFKDNFENNVQDVGKKINSANEDIELLKSSKIKTLDAKDLNNKIEANSEKIQIIKKNFEFLKNAKVLKDKNEIPTPLLGEIEQNLSKAEHDLEDLKIYRDFKDLKMIRDFNMLSRLANEQKESDINLAYPSVEDSEQVENIIDKSLEGLIKGEAVRSPVPHQIDTPTESQLNVSTAGLSKGEYILKEKPYEDENPVHAKTKKHLNLKPQAELKTKAEKKVLHEAKKQKSPHSDDNGSQSQFSSPIKLVVEVESIEPSHESPSLMNVNPEFRASDWTRGKRLNPLKIAVFAATLLIPSTMMLMSRKDRDLLRSDVVFPKGRDTTSTALVNINGPQELPPEADEEAPEILDLGTILDSASVSGTITPFPNSDTPPLPQNARFNPSPFQEGYPKFHEEEGEKIPLGNFDKVHEISDLEDLPDLVSDELPPVESGKTTRSFVTSGQSALPPRNPHAIAVSHTWGWITMKDQELSVTLPQETGKQLQVVNKTPESEEEVSAWVQPEVEGNKTINLDLKNQSSVGEFPPSGVAKDTPTKDISVGEQLTQPEIEPPPVEEDSTVIPKGTTSMGMGAALLAVVTCASIAGMIFKSIKTQAKPSPRNITIAPTIEELKQMADDFKAGKSIGLIDQRKAPDHLPSKGAFEIKGEHPIGSDYQSDSSISSKASSPKSGSSNQILTTEEALLDKKAQSEYNQRMRDWRHAKSQAKKNNENFQTPKPTLEQTKQDLRDAETSKSNEMQAAKLAERKAKKNLAKKKLRAERINAQKTKNIDDPLKTKVVSHEDSVRNSGSPVSKREALKPLIEESRAARKKSLAARKAASKLEKPDQDRDLISMSEREALQVELPPDSELSEEAPHSLDLEIKGNSEINTESYFDAQTPVIHAKALIKGAKKLLKTVQKAPLKKSYELENALLKTWLDEVESQFNNLPLDIIEKVKKEHLAISKEWGLFLKNEPERAAQLDVATQNLEKEKFVKLHEQVLTSIVKINRALLDRDNIKILSENVDTAINNFQNFQETAKRIADTLEKSSNIDEFMENARLYLDNYALNILPEVGDGITYNDEKTRENISIGKEYGKITDLIFEMDKFISDKELVDYKALVLVANEQFDKAENPNNERSFEEVVIIHSMGQQAMDIVLKKLSPESREKLLKLEEIRKPLRHSVKIRRNLTSIEKERIWAFKSASKMNTISMKMLSFYFNVEAANYIESNLDKFNKSDLGRKAIELKSQATESAKEQIIEIIDIFKDNLPQIADVLKNYSNVVDRSATGIPSKELFQIIMNQFIENIKKLILSKNQNLDNNNYPELFKTIEVIEAQLKMISEIENIKPTLEKMFSNDTENESPEQSDLPYTSDEETHSSIKGSPMNSDDEEVSSNEYDAPIAPPLDENSSIPEAPPLDSSSIPEAPPLDGSSVPEAPTFNAPSSPFVPPEDADYQPNPRRKNPTSSSQAGPLNVIKPSDLLQGGKSLKKVEKVEKQVSEGLGKLLQGFHANIQSILNQAGPLEVNLGEVA
ncbi:MAG: hypothetical protein H0X29_09360, partial [Parachlamydiaceae bacterium]|nr:hypothetical protein [Parachlamydiaceae bacterium]